MTRKTLPALLAVAALAGGSSESGGNEGVGFAIPADTVKAVTARIIGGAGL